MKKIYKFLAAAAVVASASMTSCTGDLDLLPTDPNTTTAADFDSDPEGYMDAVMADVYLQYAVHGANNNSSVSGFDGGMSTFQRSAFILEEVPSDEANWIPADADYGTFQYGIVPANNRVVLGTYSRFMICVAVCNDFIQTVNGGYFNLSDDLKPKADEYIRQCRVLRAGAYFYLVDCFGNVPYADENTAIGSVPAQLPRAEVYQKVVADLEDVLAEYNQVNVETPYGYVGKDVAEALLVKFYLNAEVYTGTPQWTLCAQHAENIINRLKGPGFKGSGLANHYHQLFAANNDQYSIGGSNAVNEIIWNIPADYDHLRAWAGATFMLYAWIGSPDDFDFDYENRYNAGDKWKCMTARREFVEKFDWDAEFKTSPDKRTALWATAADGFGIDNTVLDQLHYGNNGFLPVKFTNYALDENGEIDLAASPERTNQLSGDCPIIRLAEIYLSAAEAMLKGGGDHAKALEYVNIIRERAGLEPWSAAQLTTVSLQDERCRELYTENVRRSDLIRYGKWISGYTWSWKNNVREGSDFLPNFNLYPMPSTIVSLAGYTQNPGY